MSALPEDTPYTVEEYLALERAAEYKSEYLDGHIVAMTGASAAHNQITINVGGSMLQQFKGRPCFVYTSDMRVRVRLEKRTIYTYPDVVAVCGAPQFEDDQVDTLTNPTVLIEVLSHSTEKYDRGEKFRRYRTVASLQEYLLISQDTISVEHYLRRGEQWVLTEIHRLGDPVRLTSVDCVLPLVDIYDKVEF